MNRNESLTYAPRRPTWRAAVWLLLWALWVPLPGWSAEQVYTVKRGDTVASIARRYGIAPAKLAERNGLSRNYYIYAGQRLVIPGRPGTRRTASVSGPAAQNIARVTLPRSIQQAIDNAPVRAGRWQYIVVHHSYVDTGTVKGMDKYHREVRRMENGLAYHFVIGNGSGMGDGEIAVCRRWMGQLDGGHLASAGQNRIALGICLVGNFENHPPSRRQMESLRALIEALMVRCRLTPRAVKSHQQINVVHTRCPGGKFPMKSLLRSLESPGR